jgi:hypothetical protein
VNGIVISIGRRDDLEAVPTVAECCVVELRVLGVSREHGALDVGVRAQILRHASIDSGQILLHAFWSRTADELTRGGAERSRYDQRGRDRDDPQRAGTHPRGARRLVDRLGGVEDQVQHRVGLR